jgi:hypothetical protein
VLAIVPLSSRPVERFARTPRPGRALTWWGRGALLGFALALAAVFGVAGWVDPYDADGRPLRMATHRQLGLPPCTFYALTGLPCPSCGMTTSFALLVRGDVRNSLAANAVGTLLAVFCLALVPWALACALRGRLFGVRSLDGALTWFVLVLLALLVGRWAIVLGLTALARSG